MTKRTKNTLARDGKHSSKALVRKLGIPAAMIHRRRKRLEKAFPEVPYTFDQSDFR